MNTFYSGSGAVRLRDILSGDTKHGNLLIILVAMLLALALAS